MKQSRFTKLFKFRFCIINVPWRAMSSEFVCPPSDLTFRVLRQNGLLKLNLVMLSGQLPESHYSLRPEPNVL